MSNLARLGDVWKAATQDLRLAVVIVTARYLGSVTVGMGFILNSIGWSGYPLIILGIGLIVASLVIRTGWWLVQKLR